MPRKKKDTKAETTSANAATAGAPRAGAAPALPPAGDTGTASPENPLGDGGAGEPLQPVTAPTGYELEGVVLSGCSVNMPGGKKLQLVNVKTSIPGVGLIQNVPGIFPVGARVVVNVSAALPA